MIRLTKKKRKSLLTENKYNKYIKYAIGEILLVVIGILIAISINGYYEDYKKRKIEIDYLNLLHAEFNKNLVLLDTAISQANELSKRAEYIYFFFNSNILDTISEEQISKSFSKLNNEVIYLPSNGVLLEILNSGNLLIFENEELRHHLASFEKTVEGIKTQEKEVLNLKYEINLFLRQKGSIAALNSLDISAYSDENFSGTKSNKQLFNSEYFLNMVIFYSYAQKATVDRYYKGLKEEIKKIIVIIEEELRKYQ